MTAFRYRLMLSSLFVAGILTAALIAIFFAGWKLAGLPFVPFDVFDWLARVLPGRVIAFGISTMVTVIRALNLGPTAETAKMAEQAMAIAGLFITGVVGSMILFTVLRAIRELHAAASGLVLGIILGVPATLITLHASQTATVSSGARAVWILGLFLSWGAVLGHAGQRLIRDRATNGVVVRSLITEVDRIDRRRFMVRLGGTAAAITVVGAVVGELSEARQKEAVMMANGGRSDGQQRTRCQTQMLR